MKLFDLIMFFLILVINCSSQTKDKQVTFHLDSITKHKLMHLDSLLCLDSCNVNLLLSKAQIFDEIKKTDYSLYYYFKVINIDSLNVIAIYNIGVIYYNKAQGYYVEKEPMSLEEYHYKQIMADNYFNISRIFFNKILAINSEDNDVIQIINKLNSIINCKDWIRIKH